MAFSDSSRAAPAIRRLIDLTDPRCASASLSVDGEDDMYAFGIGVIGHEPLATMAYFRAGLGMLASVEAVVDWYFGGLENVESFLDFAAGYGRVTRFLATKLDPSRITVSEIQPDALAFQARTFGVHTLQSTHDPADLKVTRQYSVVFVASLLTHLPRATFTAWLSKLWEFVAPGGLLAFSTHDEYLDRHDAPWDDGFAFVANSEVASLDTDEYGTNWTTEAFVRARLRDTVGDAAGGAVRLPQGLGFWQDLWVVTRGEPQPTPISFDIGPEGAIESFTLTDQEYAFSGWAADRGLARVGAPGHRIERVDLEMPGIAAVELELGGQRAHIPEALGRPDEPLLAAAGFEIRGTLERRLRVGDLITLTAVCEHGARFVIDSGLAGEMIQRFGARLPQTPLRRRLETARLTFDHAGAGGLIRIAPRVAATEWHRLGRTLRSHGPGR